MKMSTRWILVIRMATFPPSSDLQTTVYKLQLTRIKEGEMMLWLCLNPPWTGSSSTPGELASTNRRRRRTGRLPSEWCTRCEAESVWRAPNRSCHSLSRHPRKRSTLWWWSPSIPAWAPLVAAAQRPHRDSPSRLRRSTFFFCLFFFNAGNQPKRGW